MAKKSKNGDSSIGLILLVLLLLGTVAYVYIYDKNHKDDDKPVVEQKKEEAKYSEDDYKNLYEQIKLNFNDENTTIFKNDFTFSETEKTSATLSDDLKIIYAFKNMHNNYIENDNTKRANINNYVFTNKKVRAKNINNISSLYFGVKPNHKTVYTYENYYLFDKKSETYYIYKRDYTSTINKVTHYEGSYDDKYIYIDEYVAYTNTKTEPAISYTHFNNLLPIDITKENILENLDIIDHFKYTFQYIESNKVFQLVKIEYIKPNE